MKKILIIVIIAIVSMPSAFAGPIVKDIVYATHDTTALRLDIYYPDTVTPQTPCILFAIGGGYMKGDKTDSLDVKFSKKLADLGYTVVVTNYRLGLKGMKKIGVSSLKPVLNSVKFGAEDFIIATKFLIDNASELKINPDLIVGCGSSSGAINVLQADYAHANGQEMASILPPDFRYAGMISMAGGILSFEGKPKYRKHAPAPTLFFHGTEDNVIFYNRLQVLWVGLFGPKTLLKIFDKNDYPYFAMNIRGMTHELAEMPQRLYLGEIVMFIDNYVVKRRPLQVNVYLKDFDMKPYFTFDFKYVKDMEGNADKMLMIPPTQ